MSVARHGALEDFCELALSVEEDVSHLHVRRVSLQLDFRQLYFFGMCPNVCSLSALFLSCETHVAVHDSPDCRLEPYQPVLVV